MISAASLITGIGNAVGLEHVHVDGITGSQDSNIAGKIAAAQAELKKKDFVLVNIKGADESGHDGLAVQKKNFIEKIDAVLEPLLAQKDTHHRHLRRPLHTLHHQGPFRRPVPVIIRGDGVRMDDVVRFDEYSCAKGGLYRIRGCDLMPIALDLINKAHKFGA